MYHDVAERSARAQVGMQGSVADRYKLDPGSFVSHLDAIEQTGRQVGLLQPDGPWPEIALTFDDGGASSLEIASLLEERGWRGHFFVTTGFIGTPGFLTEEEIRDLAGRGHVIGGHSVTHPRYMGRLSRPELDTEWVESRSHLARILSEPPPLTSIPGGYFSKDAALSAAAAGYRMLLTSEPRTRPLNVPGIVCLGRYTMWATTPSRSAAAYAAGAKAPRARAWVEWNLKKLSKRAAPPVYRLLQRGRARTG
jgi:peptidoglycan/xylan/chitin deacetylase (PgdA/CDA1 family)